MITLHDNTLIYITLLNMYSLLPGQPDWSWRGGKTPFARTYCVKGSAFLEVGRTSAPSLVASPISNTWDDLSTLSLVASAWTPSLTLHPIGWDWTGNTEDCHWQTSTSLVVRNNESMKYKHTFLEAFCEFIMTIMSKLYRTTNNCSQRMIVKGPKHFDSLHILKIKCMNAELPRNVTWTMISDQLEFRFHPLNYSPCQCFTIN